MAKEIQYNGSQVQRKTTFFCFVEFALTFEIGFRGGKSQFLSALLPIISSKMMGHMEKLVISPRPYLVLPCILKTKKMDSF